MFITSTAIIGIKRKEPRIEDICLARELVLKRNSLITEKVVTNHLLKSKPKAASKSKIAKEWEFEKRLDRIEPFLKEFNRWREYYVDIHTPWKPKNLGQITCIENVIEECEKNKIDLSVFIACQFKALAWKPATPAIQQMNMEKYEKHLDEVLNDADEQYNMEDCLY